jgi:hypothetical protein
VFVGFSSDEFLQCCDVFQRRDNAVRPVTYITAQCYSASMFTNDTPDSCGMTAMQNDAMELHISTTFERRNRTVRSAPLLENLENRS